MSDSEKRLEITIARINECLDPTVEITTKEVIYLMNSLRNLLELGDSGDRYGKYAPLNFFCNWCLHTCISKSDYENLTIKPEADFAETNRIRKDKGLDLLGGECRKNSYMQFVSNELVQTITLRNQILDLLSFYEIPTELISQKDGWWAEYRRKLLETLVASPYQIKEHEAYVVSIVMEQEDEAAKANPETYLGRVFITFCDGEMMDLTVLDATERVVIAESN